MTHVQYIIAAYGFTALVTGVLIVWSVVQYRAQRRALDAFEKGRK